MAYQSRPNDPNRANTTDDETRRQAQIIDNKLQPDPELAEGPANAGKVAMYIVAIAVVIGAVFYGLNNSSVKQAGTSPPSQTAQTTPAAPAGMRDVTPRNNSAPGTTTGAAPSRPATPAAPASPDMNKSATPPANGAQQSK